MGRGDDSCWRPDVGARLMRSQEISHILRNESAELAAKAAIWRAHYKEKHGRSARSADMQRATSARNVSQPHLPNGHARQPLKENEDTQHRHLLLQGQRQAALAFHHGGWRAGPMKGPTDLELYRPPPVLVPSDESLCYLY